MKNTLLSFLAEIISGTVLLSLSLLYRVFRDEMADFIIQAIQVTKVVDIFSTPLIFFLKVSIYPLIFVLTLSIYLFLKSRKLFIRLKYRKHPEHP